MPALVLIGLWAAFAHQESLTKRFRHRRFQVLWESSCDRLAKFHSAVKQLRSHGIADLSEMPRTIQRVAEAMYCALRRADLVFGEIEASEGWMVQPPPSGAMHSDAQAMELYRIADKNIAEYRQQLRAVLSGVQRTEAQAAVFTTTLDTLRVKMLSYRLTSRSPDMPNDDFLESLTEAKMQLQAIDRALEEIELTPFPKSLTVLPHQESQDAHQAIRRD